MQGLVQFTAGFNCELSQVDVSRTLLIAPLSGANANTDVASEICANYGELPLFVGETTAAGSKFLSGGPACDELITSINGVVGPNVNINGGEGITITSNPAGHVIRLIVSDNVISKNC